MVAEEKEKIASTLPPPRGKKASEKITATATNTATTTATTTAGSGSGSASGTASGSGNSVLCSTMSGKNGDEGEEWDDNTVGSEKGIMSEVDIATGSLSAGVSGLILGDNTVTATNTSEVSVGVTGSTYTDTNAGSTSGNGGSSSSSGNGGGSITDYITKNKENYKKKVVEEVEKALDRATADWICDNCNGQNFAKLLSGVVRTKCFKCQTVRSASCSLVLSVAEVIHFYSFIFPFLFFLLLFCDGVSITLYFSDKLLMISLLFYCIFLFYIRYYYSSYHFFRYFSLFLINF